MRGLTKVLTAVTAVGLAATMAACSSDKAKPQAQFSKLTGGTTSIKFAPSFIQAVVGLKVTPKTVGGAKLDLGNRTVSFPITGGNVKIYKKGDVTPYVQGEIDHKGALELIAGKGKKKTVIALKKFVIDPGNNSKLSGDVYVNGKRQFQGAKLFDLDGGTLKTPTVDSKTGVATLTGTTVYVAQDVATALNAQLHLTGKKKLPTGFEKIKVGIATIKAKGTK